MTEKSIREQYISGELFSVGDIVLDKNKKTLHEVVGLGTNYLNMISETGTVSKAWVQDLILANTLKEDFNALRRRRSSSNQVAFAGYKTKNFTEEVYLHIRQIIKEHKEEKFAVLNLIRTTDELLGEAAEVNVQNYNKVRTLYERSEKYLDKFTGNVYHGYREPISESITLFEIENGIKVSCLNKVQAANLLGEAIGSHIYNVPEKTVNEAARIFKSGKHTPEVWKTVGNLFNMASDLNIEWDKSIFSESTKKSMGVH